MALAPHHAINLETLSEAFERDDVAILEARRRSDGETVALLVAVGWDADTEEYAMTPFAEMVNGNPFELYDPPSPDGGFYPASSED